MVLLDNLFIQLLDVDLQRQIANTHDCDEEVTKALTMMLEQGPTALRWELGDWTIENFEGRDIVFFKGKNYIPRDDNLQQDITRMFHDHETAGHPGELETYNTLRQHYWWPRLCTYVKNYVHGCGSCQKKNNSKSIDRCLDLRISLLKELIPHDHLQTAIWISSLTCHLLMVLILFWSW